MAGCASRGALPCRVVSQVVEDRRPADKVHVLAAPFLLHRQVAELARWVDGAREEGESDFPFPRVPPAVWNFALQPGPARLALARPGPPVPNE